MAYDTDLTDEQWATIKPFIPPPQKGGRPRTTDERVVVNGLLYLVTGGCKWRLLPKEFGPWQTVYRYFAEWRRLGVWRRIHEALYTLMRAGAGAALTPSYVVIDTQSVKTGKVAAVETRGFDGGKKIKGRKRVLVVDSQGLMVNAQVVPANTHDTKAAQKVLAKVARRRSFVRSIETVHADKGFDGKNLAGWVRTNLGAVMRTTENPAQKEKKFIPVKKRWVVERSFAWVLDYWRLSVDRERHTRNSLAMLRLAFMRIMLRRIYPPDINAWN